MKQLHYSIQIFLQKLRQSRMYTLLILETYILYIYVQPVIKFSQDVKYPSTPWLLPFLFSNIYFIFLFMLGVVYMFSDVPFMQHYYMYQIVRIGRKRWAIGQIVSIIFQSLFLMFFHLSVSILWIIRHCEWKLEWGKLLHTVALTNASAHYGFLFEVPYSAIQKYSPQELTILTLFIGTFVIAFTGVFMFAICLILNRYWAIAAAVAMISMVYLVHNANPAMIQKISAFAPVSWIQTTNIGTKMYNYYTRPSLTYIVCALCIGIVIFSILIIWRVNYVEFLFSKED